MFTFRDIPKDAYPYGILFQEEDGYGYFIASPEKAICDQLYKMPPISNQKEVERLLFENLRIYESEFKNLNVEDMIDLSSKYHSANLKLFASWLKRRNMQ